MIELLVSITFGSPAKQASAPAIVNGQHAAQAAWKWEQSKVVGQQQARDKAQERQRKD